MARIHAQAANFSFNAVAIEDELNKIEMSIDVDTPEITAFADTGKAFVVGKYDAKYEVAGSADFAASQGDATIYAAIVAASSYALIYDPVGGVTPAAGNPVYTQTTAMVKSYKLTSAVADAVRYTATFQGSGLNDRDVT
jgi:hypothetical protein